MQKWSEIVREELEINSLNHEISEYRNNWLQLVGCTEQVFKPMENRPPSERWFELTVRRNSGIIAQSLEKEEDWNIFNKFYCTWVKLVDDI